MSKPPTSSCMIRPKASRRAFPTPAMYKPLGQRQIRVLDLRADLTGSLRHIPIDPYQYTALSYVWGPVRDCSLDIDGTPFAITRYLYDTLREIALGTFWVDQICINQSDEDEKAAQTQLMSKIFQRRVTGWLGLEEAYTGLVIQFLRGLADNALGETIMEWTWPG